MCTKNNTIKKQATLGLPWTLQGEKERGKPFNSLAKEKSYEPRVVGLVHFADPQSMDYPIWTTKWTTLMDSQMDYLDGLPIWTTY